MSDRILLEEFHLTLTAGPRRPDADREAMRRTLNSRRFREALRKAITGAVGGFPTLARVRWTLTN